MSRVGLSSSTSFSNGRSWCSRPPTTVLCTRLSISSKFGAPSMSVLNTSVFTSRPIIRVVSGCSRFATSLPTTRSCWPLYRWRNNLKVANRKLNRLTWHSPARRLIRCDNSRSMQSGVFRAIWSPGDGTSIVGSSRLGSGSASLVFQ